MPRYDGSPTRAEKKAANRAKRRASFHRSKGSARPSAPAASMTSREKYARANEIVSSGFENASDEDVAFLQQLMRRGGVADGFDDEITHFLRAVQRHAD